MYANKIAIALATTFLVSGSTLAAEAAVTRGMACYNIGYRFSTCALASAAGLPCPPSWDFVVPDRCKETNELKRGIREGTQDFYEKAKSITNR